MRQELADALAASSLTESRRRIIRERFASDRSPEKLSGAFTDQHAAHLKAVITKAEAEQQAEAASPKTQLRAQLEAAMFGTPTPRDPAHPETLGISRPGHAKDGWRDGASRPFTATVASWPTSGKPAAARKLLRTLNLSAVPAVGASLTFDVLEDEPSETREQYEDLGRLIDAGHLA